MKILKVDVIRNMMFNSIKRLLKEGEENKNIIILFILYFSIAIANIFVAKSTGIIVQNAILNDMPLVIKGLFILVSGKLIYSILQYFSGMLSCNIKEKLIVHYRMISVVSIISAKYEWIQKLNVGDILGRMQEDVSITAEAIAVYVPDIARRLIISLTILTVIICDNLELGLAFLIPIPFLFILQSLGGHLCDKYMSDSRKSESERDAQIQDILNNRNSVKFFQSQKETIGWARDKINNYITKSTKAMIMLAVSFSPAVIVNSMPTLLLCGVGCSLVVNGKINVESLVTAITLSMYAADELRGLTNAFANLPNMMSYSKRLFPLWDAPKECRGTEIPETNKINISFNNVSFTYGNEGDAALDNFNLNVESGEFVALVGPSGCGKSTVLKLAAGLYEPSKGEILVSGVNLNNWNRDIYNTRMALLTQDSYVFPISLLENLKCICKNDNLNNILDQLPFNSILKPLIDSLPNGLNTKVEEQGSNLSGGQKQRIAIARALIRNPDLLLLDEVTSALDSEAENDVYSILKKHYKEKAILMTAHRLSSIINASRIVVMDKGKIVGQGTHEELLKNNRLYAQLYQKQCKEVYYNER